MLTLEKAWRMITGAQSGAQYDPTLLGEGESDPGGISEGRSLAPHLALSTGSLKIKDAAWDFESLCCYNTTLLLLAQIVPEVSGTKQLRQDWVSIDPDRPLTWGCARWWESQPPWEPWAAGFIVSGGCAHAPVPDSPWHDSRSHPLLVKLSAVIFTTCTLNSMCSLLLPGVCAP